MDLVTVDIFIALIYGGKGTVYWLIKGDVQSFCNSCFTHFVLFEMPIK